MYCSESQEMHLYLLRIYKIQLLLVLFVLYSLSDLADERIGDRALVVQWLRLCAPNARGPGSIPDQGTRFHLPQQSSHVSTKEPECCNKD